MSAIRAALATLERGLSVSYKNKTFTPIAYESVPDKNVALSKQPAVFENFTYAPREVGQMGSYLETMETVRVRFTSYLADFDQSVELADAFKTTFVQAVAAQRRAGARLGGTFEMVTMAESETTDASFDGRAGWELQLDFTKFATVTFV